MTVMGECSRTATPGLNCRLGYAGGLWDGSTGLIRFGFRDYDPQAGRWTTRDPILYAGGQVNLYAYVGMIRSIGEIPMDFSAWGPRGMRAQEAAGGFARRKRVLRFVSRWALELAEVWTSVPLENWTETDQSVKAELMAGCFDVAVGGQCKLDGCGNFKCKDRGKAGPVRSDGTMEGTSVRVGKIGGGWEKDLVWGPGKIAGEKCVKF